MKQPFAVFDIDGTLVRWQMYHAIADELAKQGYLDQKAYDVIKKARMDWKKRKHDTAFKDYETQLVDVYDSALKNLSPDKFDTAVEAVIKAHKQQTYTYTRELVKHLKAQGYLLFAISGSQTEPVARLAEYYGFDDYLGTEHIRRHGKFTGEIIYHAADKQKALAGLVEKHGVDYKGSLAIGDSLSDVSMLEVVDNPIAFNPNAELFEIAKQRGWKIVIERKNVIYELESSGDKYLLA